jgi:adenosylhomocysteinase
MDREQFICQHIIGALKNGRIPTHGLDRIAIGRGEELKRFRADLKSIQKGGAWVRCLSGDYGAGKTFLCSLLREEAWHQGFVVAAVGLGRDAPLHRFEVISHRIIDGMRTEHFREVPAFEFIVQEWLFKLEQEVRSASGLKALNPEHRAELATGITQRIGEQLAALRIYDSSFASALRSYYEASVQGDDVAALEAVSWLKGEPNLPTQCSRELPVRGGVGQNSAADFLQAMATLVVHIGYAGLIVIFDELESIRGIARPHSRNAAYENILFLIDKTAKGEFAHCGFVLAGSTELFNDELQGIASYPALHERLNPEQNKRRRRDARQPLLVLRFEYGRSTASLTGGMPTSACPMSC